MGRPPEAVNASGGDALFGSAPKKPKNPAVATRRKEVAAKVAK